MDDYDRQNSTRSASVPQAKGTSRRSSCWLLPEQGFRNPLFTVKTSSVMTLQFNQYNRDPDLSALHQVSNILWRKKHQSHLTNREAEAQSSALHCKPQLTAYFLHFSSLLCPLGCTDIQQLPNSTSAQSEHMSSETDKKTQPVPLYTFISRHWVSLAYVSTHREPFCSPCAHEKGR